jgi:biopolymer transport protein ExbD
MKSRSFLKKLSIISFGASMADIAMLLLVFFMATTSTEPPKGVDVNLPKALTSGAEQDSFYITISMSGNIYIDGNPVTLSQLRDHLAMRLGEKDRVVSVTADKNLSYAQVSTVLDLLRDLDFLNVVFMSEPNGLGGAAI